MMMVISYNIVSVFFVVSSLEVACSKEAFWIVSASNGEEATSVTSGSREVVSLFEYALLLEIVKET